MKIIYDLDDVLHGFNERASCIAGVEYSRINKFDISKADKLTENERKRLLGAYHTPGLYSDFLWYKGIDRIFIPEQYGHTVHIVTNCFPAGVTGKEIELRNIGIDKDHYTINVIGIGKHTKKEIDADTDIFIDDSPHNIAKSPAWLNIVPEKPWNVTPDAIDIMQGKNIMRFKNLLAITEFLEILCKRTES